MHRSPGMGWKPVAPELSALKRDVGWEVGAEAARALLLLLLLLLLLPPALW